MKYFIQIADSIQIKLSNFDFCYSNWKFLDLYNLFSLLPLFWIKILWMLFGESTLSGYILSIEIFSSIIFLSASDYRLYPCAKEIEICLKNMRTYKIIYILLSLYCSKLSWDYPAACHWQPPCNLDTVQHFECTIFFFPLYNSFYLIYPSLPFLDSPNVG